MKLKIDNHGHSLMELITVMAIIAILATIAVPSFKTYRAKALQKEGFALMNSYYAHAQQARMEYKAYPGNLVGTNFSPRGLLAYRLRIENNPNSDTLGLTDNDPGCIATWANCDCAGAGCIDYERNWQEKPAGIIGQRLGPQTVRLACAPLPVAHASDNTFSVRVAAVISTTSTNIDRYGMSETKEIIMCEDGLK